MGTLSRGGATNLDSFHDDIISEIINLIYPIGSVYISVNSTDPSNLFGGKWEQLKDRFLLGCGTKTNGTIGGEENHTLSINEMPSHNHNAVSTSGQSETLNLYPFSMVTSQYNIVDTNVIRPTGGGQAHNNMPPYLVVYIWKRTA